MKDKKLILRKPIIKDIKDRFECGENHEIVKMYGAVLDKHKEFKEENAESWYKEQKNEKYGWVIEYEGLCIGSARLHTPDKISNSMFFAIGIFNEEYLGKGLGTEVANMVLDYGFNQLKLEKVCVRVLEYNKRAIKSYEKNGFKFDCKEKKAVFIDDRWYDDLILCLKTTDYIKSE